MSHKMMKRILYLLLFAFVTSFRIPSSPLNMHPRQRFNKTKNKLNETAIWLYHDSEEEFLLPMPVNAIMFFY